MEQSPWEASRFSASQEIPRILCIPQVHYCLYKYLPPAPNLIQINPLHYLNYIIMSIIYCTYNW